MDSYSYIFQDLDSLRDDLIVMEMIVYDCNYGDSMSFDQLQHMSDLDRLKVIMSKVKTAAAALNISSWLYVTENDMIKIIRFNFITTVLHLKCKDNPNRLSVV